VFGPAITVSSDEDRGHIRDLQGRRLAGAGHRNVEVVLRAGPSTPSPLRVSMESR
jgi:hypothetical protein